MEDNTVKKNSRFMRLMRYVDPQGVSKRQHDYVRSVMMVAREEMNK